MGDKGEGVKNLKKWGDFLYVQPLIMIILHRACNFISLRVLNIFTSVTPFYKTSFDMLIAEGFLTKYLFPIDMLIILLRHLKSNTY